MSAIFVTGAGTDVGKTFLTTSLVRHLRERGDDVDALKPIVSGFTDFEAAASDTVLLLDALGRDVTDRTIDQMSPWRFREPLSPDMAAAREGRAIDFDELVAHSREAMAKAPGPLVIEGVGGVLVPLDRSHTVADWIDALDVPVLLVGGTYLGSLNHILTALEVLRKRGRDVRAVAASESLTFAVPLGETIATLGRFSHGVPVVAIERDAGYGNSAFSTLASLAFPA